MQSAEPCVHWTLDNYTDSLYGRLIYKDECCRCFATPKSESGLDVCLKCFVGSCNPAGVGAGKNHSCIHYKNTQHPLVLQIFKTPKKVEGEPVKVTKLAIGKPGGIDPEQDRFETAVKVWCHACQTHLDYTHPKISSMVDSVLLAQSAYESAAVTEWELEIKPCEHTLTLDQSQAVKIATKALAHC